MRHSLLIIDFDSQSRYELLNLFDTENYFVAEATTIFQVTKRIEYFSPDIIIVNYDGLSDGIGLCQQIRTTTDKPILVITSPLDDESKLSLFAAGIDTYLTRPINTKELFVRVKTLLRRTARYSNDVSIKAIKLAGLEINPNTLTLSTENKMLKLTKKETEILLKLASEPGRVFSREYLLTTVWGYQDVSDTRTVDTHIRRLRSRFDALGDICWSIRTIPTVGFKICMKDVRLAVSS